MSADLTSIDKLVKVLVLERRQGHANRAVIGGLDAFVAVWLPEAEQTGMPADILAAVEQLRGYDALDHVDRAFGVQAVLERVSTITGRGPRRVVEPEKRVARRPSAPTVAPPPSSSPTARSSAASPPPGRPDGRRRLAADSQGDAASHAEGSRAAELDRPIVHLRGVGQKLAERLARMGVATVRDLLLLAPLRYADFRQVLPIVRLRQGQAATVVGSVWGVHGRHLPDGRHVLTVAVSDTTGQVDCVFFNQPYVEREFRPGRRVVVSGQVDLWSGRSVFRSPEWEPLDTDLVHTAGLIPFYPLTGGVGQRWLRRLVRTALEDLGPHFPDPLPEQLRTERRLPSMAAAIRGLHAPVDEDDLRLTLRRLAFDELLIQQLSARRRRRAWQTQAALSLGEGRPGLDAVLAGLPFELTDGQRRAIEEVSRDLSSATPMIRLLQGDVGSGKTVVAAAAVAMAVGSGAQVAVMAPTEILVDQHMVSLERLLGPVGIRVYDPARSEDGPRRPAMARLVGSMRPSEKLAVLAAARDGSVDVIVGTHAVIQEGVAFRCLGLAIVDEQHRFGVVQRSELVVKGRQGVADLRPADATVAEDEPNSTPTAGRTEELDRLGPQEAQASGGERPQPHVLIMTATPIPRTMAQMQQADLDRSVIDELPPGRTPVTTRWLGRRERERAYEYIRHRVREGEQAYVVFPMVEGSDDASRPAAVDEHERLSREVFPDLRVGLVHGRMSPQEKDSAMARFRSGDTQVLVATTVIEVGVDVPNATVMLIDGADHYGLAQLHQLRGRVGRGSVPSACLLLADDPSATARERLEAVAATNDGLALAELDLRLRGPGDFFGLQQSGMVDRFHFARRVGGDVVSEACDAAGEIMERDPDLVGSELRLLAQAVAEFDLAKERA